MDLRPRIGVRKGRWTMKPARMFSAAGGSVFLFGVLLLACGGGGGGGADGGGQQPSPQMPRNMNYNITTVQGAPLTLAYPEGNCTIDNISLAGTIRTDTLALTSGSGSRMIIPGIIYQVPSAADNQFAPLAPWVDNQLSWGSSGYPTAGQLRIINNLTGSDWILIDVDPSISPGGGVRLTNYVGYTSVGTTVNFGWEGFISVADNVSAPLFQRKASLGFSGMALGYAQAAIVIDWLAFVDNDVNVGRLASAGTAGVTENCDPRPGAPLGTRKIVWRDNVANGGVGPGDGFTVTYNQCFVDDPGDDVDEILDGTIRMNGYILTDNPFAIGMAEVRFENFSRTETHSNVVTIHTRAINGGLSFFFFE